MIREELQTQYGTCALLCAGVPGTLVWESGNHFQHAPERTARGVIWALERVGQN